MAAVSWRAPRRGEQDGATRARLPSVDAPHPHTSPRLLRMTGRLGGVTGAECELEASLFGRLESLPALRVGRGPPPAPDLRAAAPPPFSPPPPSPLLSPFQIKHDGAEVRTTPSTRANTFWDDSRLSL